MEHYLISETGSIYKLVDEANRAWHAGVSFWQGETDINSLSIGIELVNPGHDNGYQPCFAGVRINHKLHRFGTCRVERYGSNRRFGSRF